MSHAATAQCNPRVVSWLESMSQAAGATVIFVGCLVLVGWRLDIATLKSGLPGLGTMEANTALVFILAGVSVWLLQKEQASQRMVRIAQVCAFTVALVGLLTLSEYVFGWDIGIDQLLFRESLNAAGTSNPGRMAPATALNFLVLGLALMLLDTRRSWWPVQLLASMAAVIAMIPLIGYVYGIKSLYAISPYSSAAVHIWATFAVLCVGLLFTRPEHGPMALLASDSAGGTTARRLLPPAILTPALLAWLILAGQRARLYGTDFGLSLVVMSSIILSAVLIWWSARSLHRMDTEHKRAERRIIENTALIVAVNRDLEAFSYSVSHDLHAPIRAIDGFSRVLLEEHSHHLDVEGQRLLSIIRSNTKQMGRLIDDLLAFSQVGRKGLEKSNIEMTGLARSVVYEHLQQEPDRSVDVTIDSLAAAQGDHAMIRQVFANLISNALKFMKHQPKPAVEIGWYPEGNENIYYVKDNGIGFDMKYVSKLFGMFQRLHSAEEFDGTGVGLAIVQRIIHRHGGRVWCEGKINEGATFYFALPRGREKI